MLTRPLWREDARARAARRLRHLLVTPVMVLAGVIWGALASPAAAETLWWALGGALGFSSLAYLYLRLEPAVAHVGFEALGRRGWIAGLVWDWLAVGGTVFLLTDVFGMPTFRAVTSAIVIGGTYALGLAWFFDDSSSRLLAGFMSGGWGRPRVPFSHVETMLIRGEHRAAHDALRELVAAHPRHPRGWLALGRLLDRYLDDPDEAFRVLRDGLEMARLTADEEQMYLFEMVRVCESCDAADRALPHLRRFAEEHGDTNQGQWARSRLRHIEG